jgi:hypothetical protein
MASEKRSPAGQGWARGLDSLARLERPQNSPAAQSTQEQCVAVITKNARSDVRVTLRNCEHGRRVEIRQFDDCGTGERRSTPKGISIGADTIEQIISGLSAALRLARAEGQG